MKDNNIVLNLDSEDKPATIEDYVECWRVRIWEYGFIAMFKGKDASARQRHLRTLSSQTLLLGASYTDMFSSSFSISLMLIEFHIQYLTSNSVQDYRYFMKELLVKRAIDMTRLPLFLTTWLDKTSQYCMFTLRRLRLWTPKYLKACSWYLNYGKGFCPEEEEELKNTLDAADIASGSTAAALEDGTANVDEDDLSHLNAKDKKKALA